MVTWLIFQKYPSFNKLDTGDAQERYNQKVKNLCGGVDPYSCCDTFATICLPTYLKDHDHYFVHRESTYSLNEFVENKSLKAFKFYEVLKQDGFSLFSANKIDND